MGGNPMSAFDPKRTRTDRPLLAVDGALSARASRDKSANRHWELPTINSLSKFWGADEMSERTWPANALSDV
jgi:hypothetical protein